MIRTHLLSLVLLVSVTIVGCSTDPAQSGAMNPADASAATWKAFQADSGYRVSYPLEIYSMRDGDSPSDVLFPGTKVIEPNDAFSYQEPRAITYQLSITVRENPLSLSLNAPEALLAQGGIIAYKPEMLSEGTIQTVQLDGAEALRVDDLPVGPAGIATQIITIHQDRIVELLVEPKQLTGNQAEPYQEGEPSAANRAWIDQIIDRFEFTES